MESHWIKYTVNWSKPLIREYKSKLMFIILLMLVSVGLNLLQVNFIQQSIDAVMIRDIYKLIQVFGLFVSLTILQLGQSFLYEYYTSKVFIQMEKTVKNNFISKILGTKMSEINKENSGDLNIKGNSDIPSAINFIRTICSNFILSPLMSIAGFIYLLCYNWKLSLFVFLPLPILAVLLYIVSSKASSFFNQLQGVNGIYTEEIYDTIHGAEIIKAYTMQPGQMKKIRKVLRDILRQKNHMSFNNVLTIAMILSVTYIPEVISLVYGAYLISRGEIAISLLFGYSQLISNISSPVIFLFSSMITIKNAYFSMKRINTVMELEDEKTGGSPLEIDTNHDMAIEMSNVRFGYTAGKTILEGLNLQVKRGQNIGIVGKSGAGKSTVVQLLAGLFEIDEGSIYIFGQNINDLDLNDLRSNISYVSQQAYIIPGTIYENIESNNLNATAEDIEKAVEWARLKEFIDTLPDGLNTTVTENGGNLSGGQRQRISLARAFLRKSPIYIFDEPTSSLDPDNEAQILRKIDEIVSDDTITSLIITHNLSAIKNCDWILYIRDGRIVEQGTLNTLLKYNTEFYNQFQFAE